MFNLLLILPNIVASYLLMVGKAFEANLVYSFGYVLLIWHNLQIEDSSQVFYFAVLEVMAVMGVCLYIRGKR
jgi:hypothetical protein